MSTLLAPRTLLPSFFDDDTLDLPSPLLDTRTWPIPSVFNTPFVRNGALPAVNIKDTGKSFHVELAVPGYKKEDLKVNTDAGTLTVSAETKKESEEEKNGYTRREFSSRSFERSFQLPDHADGDNVKATYTDGVLKLTIPKTKALPEKHGKEVKIA